MPSFNASKEDIELRKKVEKYQQENFKKNLADAMRDLMEKGLMLYEIQKKGNN